MPVNIRNTKLSHPDVFCAEAKFQHAGHIKQKELFDALTEAGIPEEMFPRPPTEHVCLGRALKEVAGRRDRVEPISGGWVLTVVHHDKLDLEKPENSGKDAHEVSVTAKVIHENETTTLKIIPEDHPTAHMIRHEFESHQHLFRCSEDISKWLSRQVIPWVHGVASRSRGGSYYIAKGEGLDNMIKVKAALDKITSFSTTSFKMVGTGDLITLPVATEGTNIILKPEFAELDAIRIMLNGLIEETDSTCDDLHKKLISGDLGARGLKTQIERAIDLESKLKQYSASLGVDLEDMGSRLSELKSGLGMALAATEEL